MTYRLNKDRILRKDRISRIYIHIKGDLTIRELADSITEAVHQLDREAGGIIPSQVRGLRTSRAGV